MHINDLIQLGINGDIEALEQAREQMYQELLSTIENPETRRKVQGLHFKAKNIRFQSSNPMDACLKSYMAMMESLKELNEAL